MQEPEDDGIYQYTPTTNCPPPVRGPKPDSRCGLTLVTRLCALTSSFSAIPLRSFACPDMVDIFTYRHPRVWQSSWSTILAHGHHRLEKLNALLSMCAWETPSHASCLIVRGRGEDEENHRALSPFADHQAPQISSPQSHHLPPKPPPSPASSNPRTLQSHQFGCLCSFMDQQLVKQALDFSRRRRRKWLLLLALFGASSYGAYRFYRSPYVARKTRKLSKLFGAFVSVVELVSDSAESISLVSNDLREFLRSDSDEIPNSLRQISKIARSQEFSHSLSRVSEALTVGILRGYRLRWESKGVEGDLGVGNGSSVVDQVMDRVFSNAGTGFVSVVVGSFARNLVLGYYAGGDYAEGTRATSSVNGMDDDASRLQRWMNVVCSEECKGLIADSIQVFVSTAVAVFLDRTMNINAYDEFFAGLTNPKHDTRVRDMLVSVCNGAVETLVKTSHHVLTKKNSNLNPSSSSSSSELVSVDQVKDGGVNLTERWVFDKMIQNSKWVTSVSSTLAIPSNRRFVLNMTGRVTFETFRSLVEFFLWKLSHGLRRSVDVIHDQVIDRGLQVVRHFSARSSVIITICLALLLHILCGTRALLPA
ncbi:hypothetical protein Dimus_027964 [Dionaea muscipula]